jgi:hypothetical protein
MKKLLFIFFLLPLFIQAQVIVTVAGTGSAGYSGDGGAATNAELYGPRGVFVDGTDALYICDRTTIRKVQPSYGGTITTVAGTATSGYSGDGWPATAAQFNFVPDVFVDPKGNIYLPDAGNNRLRKVDPSGIIRTIAGTGIAGYNGDGIPATAAQLSAPTGVAVDDTGNIYIADKNNLRIRKIDTFGIISTVCGIGVSGFSPDGSRVDTARMNNIGSVRVDKNGAIIIADNIRIRRIGIDGMIGTLAGNGIQGFTGDGGPATDAQIAGGALSIDTSGNIYFADPTTDRIRKVDVEGNINTVVGHAGGGYGGDGGPPQLAYLAAPQGVAVNEQGEIFIGDCGNNRVRMVTNKAIAVEQIASRDKGGISVFPNPTKGDFSLQVNASTSSGNIQVAISDINGKEVDKLTVPTNKPTAVTSCYAPGMYMMSANSGGVRYTGQLVVE